MGMTTRADGTAVRRLIRPMVWLLYAAAALVFLAGVQLFLLTEHTDVYFAWTVAPSFTAAFLGAAYWAAVPVEAIAARQASWAQARAAIPGIWLFTTLTLVATLLHFDRFHFFAADPIPQAAARLWLGIYTVVPVALVLVGFLQLRNPGGDPDPVKVFPAWLRLAFLLIGGGLVALGVVLFATPGAFIPLWPWTLTSLTARAIGAWFLGIGAAAFFAYRENDFARIRPVGAGYTFFAALQLVALARYPAQLDWTKPLAWPYAALLIALLPIGPYLWFGFRTKSEPAPS